MNKALASWGRKLLSLGARVTLICSTLASLPLYYLSLFQIPKGVAKELASIQRRFLWSGSDIRGNRVMSLVNWDTIEAPKELGGLGIGNILARNISLLFKWIWRFNKEDDALWRKVIAGKYKPNMSNNLSNLITPRRGGPWKNICDNVKTNIKAFEVAKALRWKVGNGGKTKFWSDIWIENSTLKDEFPRLFTITAEKEATIASLGFWDGSNWQWVLQWRRTLYEWERALEEHLIIKLQKVFLDGTKPDEIVWSYTSNGAFSTKSFYNEYYNRVITKDIPIIKGIWKGHVPFKGIIEADEIRCVLCEEEIEDRNHLFLHCKFSIGLWNAWFDQWKVSWVRQLKLEEEFAAWQSPWHNSSKSKVWSCAFFVMIWSIWLERNKRIFYSKASTVNEIIQLFWLRLGWWVKGWNVNFPYTPDQVARNPDCLLWVGSNDNRTTSTSEEWEPPRQGNLKWNVDASHMTNSEGDILAIGGVLRDENRNILCLFSLPIQAKEINQAEFEAIWKAIELTTYLNTTVAGSISIESDSLNAVKWSNDASTQPWSLGFTSNRIRVALRQNPMISIHYRSRNSNQLADGLAKLGNQRREVFIAWI